MATRCSVCDSKDVEIRVWWNPNTKKMTGHSSTDDELEDNYCNNCQTHQILVTDA